MPDGPLIKLAGDPELTVYPRGRDEPGVKFPHGRPEVAITHKDCVLRLFFDDMSGDGEVQEIRLLPVPDATDGLKPRTLRQFAPQAELYLALARAAIKWNRNDLRGALEALRAVGGPGRGLTQEFYRRVAQHYSALVDEGERHPVKALSESHHVTISAASRWVTEARRRGLLPPKTRMEADDA